jgi:hypothetical protein
MAATVEESTPPDMATAMVRAFGISELRRWQLAFGQVESVVGQKSNLHYDEIGAWRN